jgi:hypothetical protein
VLSFRILQIYDDPLNPADQSQDLAVRLKDREDHVAELTLGDAGQGALRYPVPPASGVGWKSVFETYRFTLAQFVSQNPNLDITRLENIWFVCNVTPTGRLFIDDIEFSAVMFDCDGDGDVDGDDIAGFVECFLQGPNVVPGCECADMNADGSLDEVDIAEFVALLVGP